MLAVRCITDSEERAKNKEKVVDRLLQLPGLQINQVDLDGATALLHATAGPWADTTTAQKLLKAKADVNLGKKYDGDTPLLNVVTWGYIGLAKTLLQTPGIKIDPRALTKAKQREKEAEQRNQLAQEQNWEEKDDCRKTLEKAREMSQLFKPFMEKR